MTTVFQKNVDAEGNETYVEVDLNAVEIPETHPQLQKASQIIADRTERKNKNALRIKELEAELEQAKRSSDVPEETRETPEPPVKTTPAPTVNVDEIIAQASQKAAEMLTAQRQAQDKAASERKTAIDAILKETGLNAAFRPVIEAIPDLSAAKAQAAFMVQQGLQFDQSASEGNGSRDTANLLSRVDEKLGFSKGK